MKGSPQGFPSPGILFGLAVLAAIRLAAAGLSDLPAPAAIDAPPAGFSGFRAWVAINTVLAGIGPHPVASPEAAKVRGRIVVALKALGLAPRVEHGWSCRDPWPACAPVANIVAEVAPAPGWAAPELPPPPGAVLLVAHYDSRPGAQGASDDGLGVAVLIETARALLADPRPGRPVRLLVTDGEEWNLSGADAFLEGGSPAARDLAAVVNVECRGTAGRALFFQTGPGNAAVVDAYARVYPRPSASSLFAAVYRALPNDTDLTVFLGRGLPGLNLAAIGNPLLYHSPLDDLAHFDLSVLQHHGEGVLALARALADPGFEPRGGEDAVFFDLLGTVVVRWPASRSAPAALLVLGLLALAARRLRARGELPPGALPRATAAAVLAPLLATLAGAVLLAALERLGAVPGPWVREPRPALLALCLATLATSALARGIAPAAASPACLALGTWIPAALLALGLALVPATAGLVHLALVPAAAGALGLLAGPGPAVVLPLLAHGLVFVPLVDLVYLGLGFGRLPAVPLVLGLALVPLLPLWRPAGPGPVRALAVAALLAAALAVAPAPYDGEHPRPLSLAYLDDRRDPAARWVAATDRGALPPALAGLAVFTRGENPYPAAWKGAPSFLAPAPRLPLPLPALAASPGPEPGTTILELSARRGGDVLMLELPATAVPGSARPEGLPPGRTAWEPGSRRVFRVPPGGSVRLVMRFAGAPPASVVVGERTPGLPPEGAALLAARADGGVPVHEGDLTFVVGPVDLPVSP